MRLAAFLPLLLIPTLAAGAPLSIDAHETMVGPVVAGVDQSVSVSGVESTTTGTLFGLQVVSQQGARFRGQLRLLGGSVEAEADAVSATSDALLFEARSTWGATTARGDRLYAGIGIERVDSASFSERGSDGWSLYVPVGLTRAADFAPGWRVRASVEAQLLLYARQRTEGRAGVPSASFNSTGGAGLRIATDLSRRGSALTISPYLHATATADSDTQRVSGVALQLEDQRSLEIGLRLLYRY